MGNLAQVFAKNIIPNAVAIMPCTKKGAAGKLLLESLNNLKPISILDPGNSPIIITKAEFSRFAVKNANVNYLIKLFKKRGLMPSLLK
jgi:hypothetical protein